jgi:hypothetical protein
MGTEHLRLKKKSSSPQWSFNKPKAVQPFATQSTLLKLQRNLGNQAVLRLFESGVLQAKLKIGEPGDIYEQEADRVADTVMRMPEPQVQIGPEDEEEEELVQTKPLSELISPLVQRQEEVEEEEEGEPLQAKEVPGHAPSVTPEFASRINAIRDGGRPFPKPARAFFEPRFNRDFSQVRVHTDARAAESARAMNARAFTLDRNIVFGAGHYSPETTEGKKLLAHELTHVIQQIGRTERLGYCNEKRKSESGIRILPHRQKVSELHHIKEALVTDIQLARIPKKASLAEFLRWTQRAIDDMKQGGIKTLGGEVLAILQGLRNHVTLRDAAGTVVKDGGTFSLVASKRFPGLTSPVSFKLIVDDKSSPSLGGTHEPPKSPGGTTLITIFANKFRGIDHADLGNTLFHEALHALFYLRRTYPKLKLRRDAERILSSPEKRTDIKSFYSTVQTEVSSMIPTDPRVASIARSLAEEILVIVETDVHEGKVSGLGGPPMKQSSFDGSMYHYIFGSGIFLTAADKAAIEADPARNNALKSLLKILYGFYVFYRSKRFMSVGVSATFKIIARPPPPASLFTPRPLKPPSFIPRITESVEGPPF